MPQPRQGDFHHLGSIAFGILAMREILRIFCVLFLLAAPSSANAQMTSALDLLRQCEGRASNAPPEYGFLVCASYLLGILDMQALLTGLVGDNGGGLFCVPEGGIEGEQALRIYVDWANQNPNQLHETARMGALFAFMSAFPCK